MGEDVPDDLRIFDKREALGLLADYAMKESISVKKLKYSLQEGFRRLRDDKIGYGAFLCFIPYWRQSDNEIGWRAIPRGHLLLRDLGYLRIVRFSH